METAWLIDGTVQTGIPPDDRGFAYGDGVFETIAAPRGLMRRFDLHYDRLSGSCKRLQIAPPPRELLERDAAALIAPGIDSVVKIIVTRGSAGRGYRPPTVSTPRRVVGVFAWPDYPLRNYTEGVRAVHCNMRLAENPVLAGMKHLCRLEQVLAQQEVAAAGADEGIVQSIGGAVVSGTSSNLFAVKDSVLITPSVERCGVAGVMRRAVMSAARSNGVTVCEQRFAADMLDTFDEIFLTNSVFGIWPVSVLEDVAFPVGSLTQWLMEYLDANPHAAGNEAQS